MAKLTLVHRASAAYRSRIQQRRCFSRLSRLLGYDSDGEDNGNGGNGKHHGNGNGKASIQNGNKMPFTFRKHRTPSDVIADFERAMIRNNGAGHSNKDTPKTSESSSFKGFIASIKDKWLTTTTVVSTTVVAVFTQLFVHVAKKFIDEKFEGRLRALELAVKNNSSAATMTPTLRKICLNDKEIKFAIPMPGMDLEHCTYCWDVDGVILNIRADNGELEYRYNPEVPRRFKFGLVTLDSLDAGFLIVSVEVKKVAMGSSSYLNSRLKRKLQNSNEQRSRREVTEMVASYLTALTLDKVILNPGNDVANTDTSSYLKTLSILDIGSRDGLLLQKLAENGFSQLTGTDSSDEAVKAAQQLAKCNGFPSIVFLVDNILKTNLKGQFCLINDTETLDALGQLHDGPVKRIKYWETVSRLVAPGGLVVITTFCHTRDQLVQEVEKFNQLKARTPQETKAPGETKSCNSRIFSYVDHTYPTFNSGGSVGSRVATVAFMRS